MGYRVAALVTVAALLIPQPALASTPASVRGGDSDQWTPFFDTGPLQNSGWASCPQPVAVSIDTSTFNPDEVNRIDQGLSRAIVLWSEQDSVRFAFDGIIPMDYDNATGVLTPHDGIDRIRHIYLGFVSDADSQQFSKTVVGLGEPTTVNETNREITAAEVTFERDYATKASIPELVALFAHEFGHALGLGHSASRGDVMYPIVSKTKHLGAGDIAGLAAIARPCPGGTPSRDYPLPQ